MVKILSVENTHSWSWGAVIASLRDYLPDCEIVRIIRGQFHCSNPKCRAIFHRNVDDDLIRYFDLVLPQNCDGIKLVSDTSKVITRIGGLVMDNPDTQRYASDFKKVAAIIATNQQLGEIALVANENTTVIPNGVDLERFMPAEVNPNLNRKFTIGFAGNIWGGGADYKDWKFFIMAQAYLAGRGVEQIHLLHNVNQIPHEEMPEKFYHQIDALILPSKGEGCSNVVSEALACGVPVLLTQVGFHGENLENEKNCLWIKRDADNIKETIERLLDDVELRTRLCQNGRKFAEEKHDVRKVAAMYDKVFKEVLKKTGKLEN